MNRKSYRVGGVITAGVLGALTAWFIAFAIVQSGSFLWAGVLFGLFGFAGGASCLYPRAVVDDQYLTLVNLGTHRFSWGSIEDIQFSNWRLKILVDGRWYSSWAIRTINTEDRAIEITNEIREIWLKRKEGAGSA